MPSEAQGPWALGSWAHGPRALGPMGPRAQEVLWCYVVPEIPHSNKIEAAIWPSIFCILVEDLAKEEISETSALQQQFKISYDLKELQLEALEPGLMRQLEKSFLLEQIDFAWKEHLQKISSLRDSIRWRSYGQRNPLTDYKRESYNLFIRMSMKLRHRVIYFILRSKILLTN